MKLNRILSTLALLVLLLPSSCDSWSIFGKAAERGQNGSEKFGGQLDHIIDLRLSVEEVARHDLDNRTVADAKRTYQYHFEAWQQATSAVLIAET